MSRKLELDDRYIFNLYTKERKTIAYIANLCKCGETTIGRRLNKLGRKNIPKLYNTKSTKGKESRYWTGYEDISGHYIKSIEHGAKNRNLQFDITIEEIWNLFIEQNKKCALTGDNLYFDYWDNNHKILGTASLDRIDNNIGYTIDNVQWTHKIVNIMRSNFDIKYFVELCNLVINHNMMDIVPIIKNEIKLDGLSFDEKIIELFNNKISQTKSAEILGVQRQDVRKVLYKYGLKHERKYSDFYTHSSGTWKGIGKLPLTKWSLIEKNAQKRNIQLNITMKEASEIFDKQDGKCALSGLDIDFNKIVMDKQEKNGASLDRINSNEPYRINNVWWIHKDINRIKHELNLYDFYDICKKVVEHNK